LLFFYFYFGCDLRPSIAVSGCDRLTGPPDLRLCRRRLYFGCDLRPSITRVTSHNRPGLGSAPVPQALCDREFLGGGRNRGTPSTHKEDVTAQPVR